MEILLVARLLLLLLVANGAPVVAKKLLGATCARPIDGGARLFDGRPLLGRSKTWRGLAAALLATGLAAPLLGLPVSLGALIGAGAMAGDLLSSFVKRRLGRAPSSRALGLDQIPEALIPLLAAALFTPLGPGGVALGTAGFVLGSLALSRLMFDLDLREQPY